ncbi:MULTISPECIES: rhamnan synthesis F family protein [Burkholderia]|nr:MULTISPECIES: rhamnan synthesis F family protein [Burkholderia]
MLRDEGKKMIREADLADFRASNKFDADWYRNEYLDVALLGMDPALHYLWLGRQLGRRPGPNAESAEMLTAPRRRVTQGLGVEERIIWRESLVSGPSVAAVVHVYYADLIDEVCAHLANIPYRFSGFFAIRSSDMIELIKESLARHGADCDAHFAVTPNRGRNFGGFLVDFRKAVRAHDVCVHIHTKKSLRTGTEQRDWRGHLFDGLLGDRSKAATILNRFAEDERIGLIFPTTYEGMPSWCHHWLSAGHRVHEIGSMLGIHDLPRRGLIDFPVGSMFWARTSAIAPLLDFDWTYEHFEPEPMADDGTMAHLVERVLGVLCRAKDFDFLEFSPSENIFRRNWSEKLLHHHKEALAGASWNADNCDVLSFDFYDTLFCRRAFTPDDVHNYIGWALHMRGVIDAEGDFYRYRKAAEERARVCSGKGDVTLDDIYAYFPSVCDWSVESVILARQLEWDIEVRCLVPRQDVIELAWRAKRRGARVIIISDSYMPRHFFEQVLAEHQLTSLFDELYISSEVELRKDRSDIWPWIKAKEVDGRRYFHVGDNEHSDIQNSLAEGLGSTYVLNTTVQAHLCGLGPLENWRVSSPGWRDGIVHGPVVARLCSNAFLGRDGYRPLVLNDTRDTGYAVLGPLLFGFLTWVLGRANREKCERVFFLAREGWFLIRLYEQMRAALAPLGIVLPQGQYLAVSRRAVMGPMAAVSFEPEFIVRGSPFRGTVGELLKARLGLDIGAGIPGVAVEIDTGADRAGAISVLEQLREPIVIAASEKLVRLRQYLSQEGVDQPGGLIVDVGYSGTIQSALQTVTGVGLSGAYMVTSQAASDVVARGGSAIGYFSHDYTPCVVRNYSMILEAVLTAPHGSTVDYVQNAHRIEPVFGSLGSAQRDFAYLEELIAGASAYIGDLLSSYGPEVVMATYSPGECEAGLRQLVEGILRPPAEFWRKLNVENDFCGDGELDISRLYGLG